MKIIRNLDKKKVDDVFNSTKFIYDLKIIDKADGTQNIEFDSRIDADKFEMHYNNKRNVCDIPVSSIIISHLSNAQDLLKMGGNIQNQSNRIDFVKYLLQKYPDTSLEISPWADYDIFVKEFPMKAFH